MPDMTPIERAARALCELDNNPPGATMDGKPLWQDYLPEVRAVLLAVRELGDVALTTKIPHDADWSNERDMFWKAGIDALLAEGK